jgi:hypothetical protein
MTVKKKGKGPKMRKSDKADISTRIINKSRAARGRKSILNFQGNGGSSMPRRTNKKK